MTDSRTLLLSFVFLSACGVATAQSQVAPAAGAANADQRTPIQQDSYFRGNSLDANAGHEPNDGAFRVDWLQRLVVGESDNSVDTLLKTNASPQLSKSHTATSGQLETPEIGQQAAIAARKASANEPQSTAKTNRPSWLRQLVWGEQPDAEKLHPSVAAAPPTAGYADGRIVPPTQTNTVNGSPSTQTVASSQTFLNPQAPAVAPDRDRSWLRRLMRRDSQESSNQTAAATLAQPGIVASTSSRWSVPSAAASAAPSGTSTVQQTSGQTLPAIVHTLPAMSPPPQFGTAPVVPNELARSYDDLVGNNTSPPPINSTMHPSDPAPALAGTVQADLSLPVTPNAVDNTPVVDPFEEAPNLEGFYQGLMPPTNPPVAMPEIPTGVSPYARPKILFRPIARGSNSGGLSLLRPTAQIVEESDPTVTLPLPPQDFPVEDNLPPPAEMSVEAYDEFEGDWMPMGPEEPSYVDVGPWRECWYTLLANLNGPRSCPPGIGVENVMNAPFWLDTTQPLQNCRIQGDAAADWEFPDRLEYFWPKTPGPKGVQTPTDPLDPVMGGEPEIDYQELNFYIERGGKRFSVGTKLPIRVVDPVERRNTAGFADMQLTTKTVLLDGRDWQLTQIFHTHFPTGSWRRGTGNGHFSLEPGVAWRYKWSDVTYIHGDLTYWFPIAADPEASGQFFNYGIGISHILYDSDCWAIMPTFEINAWTLLDGTETRPFGDEDDVNEIDTYSILNIHPGVRVVCDTSGDCGVREFGITSGISVTQEHWYSEILRIELRWVF